jgi:hypothetical protein
VHTDISFDPHEVRLVCVMQVCEILIKNGADPMDGTVRFKRWICQVLLYTGYYSACSRDLYSVLAHPVRSILPTVMLPSKSKTCSRHSPSNSKAAYSADLPLVLRPI